MKTNEKQKKNPVVERAGNYDIKEETKPVDVRQKPIINNKSSVTEGIDERAWTDLNIDIEDMIMG